MLSPINSYFIKFRRQEEHISLTKLAETADVHFSYISKVENNQIEASDKRFARLLHYFNIQSYQYYNYQLSEDYIYNSLDDLYYMNFTKKKLDILDRKIAEYHNSGYICYLHLVKWCYKALFVQHDKDFFFFYNLLNSFIGYFPKKMQCFFHLCKMYDCTSTYNEDLFIESRRKFKDLSPSSWQGFETYVILCADFSFNNIINIPNQIKKSKELLQIDKNEKRFNSALIFEALYYKRLKKLDKAIELYKTLSQRYLELEVYINYAVSENNMAWLYILQKRFDLAISHYLNALKYDSNQNILFSLAWCYYNIEEISLCKKTIKMGKEAVTDKVSYSYFLDWLEKMVEIRYSKRCLNVLLRIEEECLEELSSDMRNFLYMALFNQYQFEGDLNKAIECLKEVLEKEVASPICLD